MCVRVVARLPKMLKSIFFFTLQLGSFETNPPSEKITKTLILASKTKSAALKIVHF